jgi:four helix bundle protein
VRPFRDLRVWHRAIAFAEDIYTITAQYPAEERFGLTAQTRRAASSIGANIAEGAGRESGGDFARFLRIAFGSTNECDHHLTLAYRLGLIDGRTYERTNSTIIDLRRMLLGLIRRVDGSRNTEDGPSAA